MKIIFHVDMNSFYASVECLYRPDLRHLPLAVGGSSKRRNGIILAKNELAKAYGVKTAEALWEARNKCPDLVIVPPDYELYMYYSERSREIYRDYTPLIESYGLDEAWLDLSGLDLNYSLASYLAKEMHERVVAELGVCVSIGVSWNKVFAKMASGLAKPDGTCIITEDNYQDRIWPLDISKLFYVGRAYTRKFKRIGINTIKDLALADKDLIEANFGKVGLMLKSFARGEDLSVIHSDKEEEEIKSISNSITTARDIEGLADVKLVLGILADSVAARMREAGFLAKTISISMRSTELESKRVQTSLSAPTDLTVEILNTAIALYKENYNLHLPLRSLALRASNLETISPEQLDFIPASDYKKQSARVDRTIDSLRRRFGYDKILRASSLSDEIGHIDAKNTHIISPISFIKGGESL